MLTLRERTIIQYLIEAKTVTQAVDEILDKSNKILLPRKFWEDVKEEIQRL